MWWIIGILFMFFITIIVYAILRVSAETDIDHMRIEYGKDEIGEYKRTVYLNKFDKPICYGEKEYVKRTKRISKLFGSSR